MECELSFENRIKSMNFNKSLSRCIKGKMRASINKSCSTFNNTTVSGVSSFCFDESKKRLKFLYEVEIIDVESYKYDDIIIHNYSIDNQCTCRVF